jgi:hypothetical protein
MAGRGGKRPGAGRKPKPKTEPKLLTAREELVALLRKQFPEDEKERTYLQLLLDGQARAAILGNVEAAKFLLRYAALQGKPQANLKSIRGTTKT